MTGYGGSVAESHRQAGLYTARILKGDQPANLPIVQVTKVEMIINTRTAKALGISRRTLHRKINEMNVVKKSAEAAEAT